MSTLSRSDDRSRHDRPSLVPTRVPRHVRVLTAGWGGFMLAMAAVNAWLAASDELELYVEFAETAYLELYRDAWHVLVEPNPLPWVVALVVFESSAGVATLARGKYRIVGLCAAAAFVLALAPSNAYTLGNPLLAALPAYLAYRHWYAARRAREGTQPSRP